MLQRQLHNLSEAKETACCWFYMWFTDAFLLLRTQRSRVCACICACVCLGGHVLGHVFLMSRCKSLVLFVGNSQLNIQTAESCGVSVNVFNEKFPWLAHIDKQAGAAGVRLLLKQGSGRESETLTSMFDTLMCFEVLNKTNQFRYACLGSILGTDWGANLSKSNLDDFFFRICPELLPVEIFHVYLTGS